VLADLNRILLQDIINYICIKFEFALCFEQSSPLKLENRQPAESEDNLSFMII